MEKLKIDRWLGKGAQHYVGLSPHGEVIKYPHRGGKYWDKSTAETVTRDLGIMEDYQVNIPETSVLRDLSIQTPEDLISTHYAIIAEEIRGEVLREINITNPIIKAQFKSLLEKSLDIRKNHRAALDFLGGEAAYHFLRYLFFEKQTGQLGAYNISVTEEEQVILIDTNLLDPARAPKCLSWFIYCMIDLQHMLIALMLDESSLIERCEKENQYKAINRVARGAFALSRKREKKRKAI